MRRLRVGLDSDTGSTPTDEHLAMTALLTRTLLEVARRHQDDLPGLTESCQDDVLVICGGTTRRASGWFQAGAWRYDNRPVHEVFLNADRQTSHSAASPAEDVLTTLLHEACHTWANAEDIKDTSRDGRYHNHHFAEIALQIGLEVERDPTIGHRTPGLSKQGRFEYADLLTGLADGLTVIRESRPAKVSSGSGDGDTPIGSHVAATVPTNSSKYVFASCQCQAGRRRSVTIRVAAGLWRPGVIRCSACEAAFEESDDSRSPRAD